MTTKTLPLQWGNLANIILNEVTGHIRPLKDDLRSVQDHICGTVKNTEDWAPCTRYYQGTKDNVSWSGG